MCTPYQPQSSEPFCVLDEAPSKNLSLWTSELAPSGSSETVTGGSSEPVDRDSQTFTAKSLQDAVAGSRRPVVDTVSCNFHNF